jgi:hypothetical protein
MIDGCEFSGTCGICTFQANEWRPQHVLRLQIQEYLQNGEQRRQAARLAEAPKQLPPATEEEDVIVLSSDEEEVANEVRSREKERDAANGVG